MLIRGLGLAATLLLATACGASGDDTVVVFAAASLADAFSELEEEFERQEPGLDVQLNLAGSSSLREQILEGAPADVFASASVPVMMAIEDAGLVEGAAEIFATNELTIGVPTGNPAEIRSLEDFARDDALLGLCAAGVPCGDLARDALSAAGIVPSVDTNEADVRALVTKIAEGELDAGIVYLTDARARFDVESVVIPAHDNRSTEYPLAALNEGSNPLAAQRFVAFVGSSDGRAILADHGFGTP